MERRMVLRRPAPVYHPLNNDLVLDHVFSWCTRKDLMQCRLVSRLWRQRSLKFVRCGVISIHDPAKMAKFIKYAENGVFRNKPLATHFELANIKESPKFWLLWGRQIVYLQLCGVDISSVGYLQSILFNACPALKRLILRNVQVRLPKGTTIPEPIVYIPPLFGELRHLTFLQIYDNAPKDYGITWMELFSHFANLEALHMYPKKEMFKSLALICQHNPSKVNLKHLRKLPDGAKRYPVLGLNTFLLSTNLSLEGLTVNVRSNDHLDLVLRIVNRHGKSLKSLELEGVLFRPLLYNLNLQEVEENKMENLEDMLVTGNCWGSMSFFKLTPNLKKLRIHNANFPRMITNTNQSDVEIMRFSECTHFEAFCHFPAITQTLENIRVWVKWMPNLRKLVMDRVHDFHFEVICESLPKLACLHVKASWVGEPGLTGLDVERIKEINETNNLGLWVPTENLTPNITRLQCLEELVLEKFFSLDTIVFDLGYASASCIQKLPALKHLVIQGALLRGSAWTTLCRTFDGLKDEQNCVR